MLCIQRCSLQFRLPLHIFLHILSSILLLKRTSATSPNAFWMMRSQTEITIFDHILFSTHNGLKLYKIDIWNQIEGVWELVNKWAQCRASKWESGAHSKQCIASKWVRGARERASRVNGPVLFASISKSSYLVCNRSPRLKMTIWSWIQRRISETEKCCIFSRNEISICRL